MPTALRRPRPDGEPNHSIMSTSRLIRRYGLHGLALLGYVGLTLGLTYPLVLDFGQAIPGDGFDGWQNVWNIWWIKSALLVDGVSPYYTRMVDYPVGVALHFHTLNPFNGLTFLPITLNWGNLVAYNIAILFSFVAGAYGAFLLALYVLRPNGATTGDPVKSRQRRIAAAFVAGAVFAFSPYHMAHLLGHMQLISLEWIPFFALFAIRQATDLEPAMTAGGDPGIHNKRFLRRSMWPALFLVLVVSCDWYYAFYMALFSVLLWFWSGLCRPSRWLASTLSWAATATAFLLATSFLWLPMVRESLTADYMVPPAGSTERLSADLAAFVTPSELHPWWGNWAAGWVNRFTASTSERTVFAGFSVLALAGLALIVQRRRAAFWAVSAVTFAVLALGPVLHIVGKTRFGPVGPIPLPYALLDRLIPFLRISRSVSRFDVVVMLCLAVLASIGVFWLLKRLSHLGAGSVMAICATATVVSIIAIEFLAIPYPLSFPETRPFHYRLAQEAGDFAILDIPMDWDRPANLLYQTVHGKPLISGYTSRTNPQSPAWRTPVLQTFRYLGADINDAAPPAELAATVLNDLDVRYVVVHKTDLPPGDYRQRTLELVDSIFAGWQREVDDDWLLVLSVPAGPAAAPPYLVLGAGWSEREWDGRRAWRTVAEEATLEAYLAQPGSYAIEVQGNGRQLSTHFEVHTENEPLGSYDAAPQGATIRTPTITLPAGVSRIMLRRLSGDGLRVTNVRLIPASAD